MKNVVRSLIVMLSLMMSLMIGGCGDDDPGYDDKIVALEYRGAYKEMSNPTNPTTMVLGEKTITYAGTGSELIAWTVGNVLWISIDEKSTPEEFGTFKDDKLIGTDVTYQKQ